MEPVKTIKSAGGFGLHTTHDGELRWAKKPPDRLGSVTMLAPQCFAVLRSVLLEIGGDVTEKSLGERQPLNPINGLRHPLRGHHGR